MKALLAKARIVRLPSTYEEFATDARKLEAAGVIAVLDVSSSVLRGSRKTASNFEQAVETWIEYSVCALTSLP